MPIDKKTVTECVDRLVRIPGSNLQEFGTKPKDIRDDLGRALQRHARTDEHAIRVTDKMVDECKFRPTPAEIREWCDGVAVEREKPKGKRCVLCDGTGFETRWYLITYKGASFEVEKSERVSGGMEEARDLRAKLNGPSCAPSHLKRQDVLSGAAKCSVCEGRGCAREAA